MDLLTDSYKPIKKPHSVFSTGFSRSEIFNLNRLIQDKPDTASISNNVLAALLWCILVP